jgi:hypothetical protein
MIIEGILIWMVFQTVGDREESFAKRLRKTIKKIKKEDK